MSIIKSFSVGDGDMFYINHGSDNFSVIDCCYSDEDSRDENFEEVRNIANSKGICRFISTHPDDDHIRGLETLFDTFDFLNFYCVKNEVKKDYPTDDFRKYCILRDSERAFYVYKGCKRKWMNESDEERGCAGINFLWPDKENNDYKEALEIAKDGIHDNNISPIFKYSLNEGVTALWMGDMETDFINKIKNVVNWPKVDILFAPHHGRKSGRVPSDVLEKIDPKLIVIGEAPAKDLEYYSAYNTITQNSAGNIIFDCDEYIHVYVSNSDYSVDYLSNKYMADRKDGYYIGSFRAREAK